MKRLNFGCGSIQPKGWHNLDILDFGQEYVGSTEIFDDNQFDIIVAHCSLQIVEFNDMIKILTDLRRVLKPNGVIRISLPDILKGFESYINNDKNWFPNGEKDIHQRFSAWLTWYSTTRTLLTKPALAKFLKDVGFSKINDCDFRITHMDSLLITELDTREGECYFLEAVK